MRSGRVTSSAAPSGRLIEITVTAKPIDPEKAVLRLKVVHLGWLVVVLVGTSVGWTWWAAHTLNSIDNRLAAIQAAQPSYWTVNDEERKSNWLRQDNAGLPLKVRDTRDAVMARYP